MLLFCFCFALVFFFFSFFALFSFLFFVFFFLGGGVGFYAVFVLKVSLNLKRNKEFKGNRKKRNLINSQEYERKLS